MTSPRLLQVVSAVIYADGYSTLILLFNLQVLKAGLKCSKWGFFCVYHYCRHPPPPNSSHLIRQCKRSRWDTQSLKRR